MTIGIIGLGVVGKAVENAFCNKCTVLTYDPAFNKNYFYNLVLCSNFIFVSVPTPMDPVSGKLDSSIIDSIMEDINITCLNQKISPIIIIKSTILPSIVKKYINIYPKLRLVINPEYLTDKNPNNDFVNAELLVLGGNDKDTISVQRLFEEYSKCKPCKVGRCDAIGASLLKYMANCFLATKVIFMNQFFDIFQKCGTNNSWEDLMKIFHYDSRMGNSHFHVPGTDGKRGYGGKCFPKDLSSLSNYAQEIGCNFEIIEKIMEINKKLYRK
jgi:nucleotide sugar dehydrogenase